jgi:hypothetical protein
MRLQKRGIALLLTVLFSAAATWLPMPFPSTGWKPWVGTLLWEAVVLFGYLFLESEFEWIRQFRKKTKHYIVLAIVFVVFGGLGVAFFALFESQESKAATIGESFRSEVRSVMFHAAESQLSLYMVGYISLYGKTLSPVPYLIYLQTVNLQDTPATVVSYSVAVAPTETGPWEPLRPIHLLSAQLYSLGGKAGGGQGTLTIPRGAYRLGTPMTEKDLESAIPLFPQQKLEAELNQEIAPHQTIHGWAAFDSKIYKGSAGAFRIIVKDSAGHTSTTVSGSPARTPENTDEADTQLGLIDAVGSPQNLSGFHIRYFSDPVSPKPPS